MAVAMWQLDKSMTKPSFLQNDAAVALHRLRTTPIVDGRTHWVSLSAAIDKRSNTEAMECNCSIVWLAP